MGKLYSLISALLLTVSATFAAEPDSYEWWFDNDVSSSQTGYFSGRSIDIDIDTSILPNGIHYFNLRLAEGNNYGTVYRRMFHSLGSDRGAISYQYWFDSDFDSRTSGSLDVGSNRIELDISSLPQGAHYFNMRLGYGDGTWGSVYRKMILNLTGNVNAVAYEYWIDNNYSAKTEGSLAPGSNSYSIDLKGVRRGLHRFNYRLMTGEGVWGAPFTSYFYSESSPNRFTDYEYWLDNDYANRVTGNATGNPTSFEVDLSAFDKSGGAHYFNLRTRDGDGEWSPAYRKLLVFDKSEKRVPVLGYRQYLNGKDLGYVEVERQFVDSYMFEVNLPDSLYPGVGNRGPVFDEDKVSVAAGDSVDYVMQIRTELGWDSPRNWKLELSNDFSTTAVAMEVNSKRVFDAPSKLGFAAMKFTATGDSLYFRTDKAIVLDIYKEGTKVAALAPEQVKGMATLRLETGEYYGILYGLEDAEADNFTLHLMDTPNRVPMPVFTYENEEVTISCSRSDALIRYTLDGKDPDEESTRYTEPIPMKRNGTVKAKAWIPDSDIDPSAIAELTIDSYKVEAPVAEFNLAERLLTLKTETKDASILYTHEIDPADSLGGVWTDYVDPIKIRKNGNVYSRAVFDGYHDSGITVTEIKSLPDSVPMPEISFDKGTVAISCAEKDAEIHYTLDGTRPTSVSTLYGGAFPLRRNATVMAFAFVPGLDIDSSRVATHVVDHYKVATPKGSFDVKSRLLTLTCDTVGAAISYAFDRDGEWTAYSATDRIRLRKNCIVYAKATFDGYNDSDIAEIEVRQLPEYVHQPEILCDGTGLVAIKCATEDAEIRYTVGDEEPTMESPVYKDPFIITRNTRVSAFAYVPDLDIEPSIVSSILCDIFRVEGIRSNFDSETRTLTLECATEGAQILYTFDPNGEWTEYTQPIEIRKNCVIYVKGVRDGYYDSETETITINSLADSVPVPEISFADGKVSISCLNKEAEIHYTVDNENISAESPVYKDSFTVDHNCTIRAFALIPGLDIEPSDVVTKVIDSFKVETPTGKFDAEARKLTITCATEGAVITYRIGAEGEWLPYTDPISITRNCTVYARATFDGWNDSEIAEIPVNELADSVPAPVISFADGIVTIICANSSAKIRYTIDGSDPTMESALYEDPFALGWNATVKAFAYIPELDIEPSDITTYVVSSYQTATPAGRFDVATRLLTITCATEGAVITYRIGAEGEWLPYTDPISITRNCTVYARATFDGWNDSEIAEIPVNELADSVPAPAISFADGMVTITCANSSAEIRYTVDGSDPTMDSSLYEGSFALGRNATVKAFAYIPGLDIEASEIVSEVIDFYKVDAPYGRFDAASRQLTILCETDGASIFYRLSAEGEWLPYSLPITIEGNGTVYAMATLDGWNDSEVAEITVSDLQCAPVNVSYNGRYISLETSEQGATVRYTTDGSNPSTGIEYMEEFDVEGICTVRAVSVKAGYMDSEIAEFTVDRYADEDHAETSSEGILSSAFDWDSSDLANRVDTYRVEGHLNDADYEFLRSMKELRHLDIEKVAEARLPEYAFANTKLISISLPADIAECGDSILAVTQFLSSVVWNSRTMNVEDGLTRGLSNPNVLLFVPSEVSVSRPEGINIVSDGDADAVTLSYGFPYFAARDFHADTVSLTHEFSQTTKVGIPRGWETIVLPFQPTEITHAVNGPAVPFEAWGGAESDAKPFWLGRATSDGFVSAERIEACVPYIISMPNNADYIEAYNLGGNVTFSASDVYLGPENSFAESSFWIEGTLFEGSFMPVEEEGLLSLNVGSDADGLEPGSTFIADAPTVPFGAYIRNAGARKSMPIFGGSNVDGIPMIADSGLLIESPAPGILRISSGRERNVPVTTVTGVTLRVLHLSAGETVTVEGLTRDLYIVAGRKVFVR